MILDIVKYGNPILSVRAEEVTEFDYNLRKLIADMFETMYVATGAGLAAPQVGISKRVFVMDCSSGKDTQHKIALINPIIEIEEGQQVDLEGCLSVPDFSFEIKRPHRIVVRGQDIDGIPAELDLSDFEARCVSHEIDHLDGHLLITRLTPLRRDLVERKIRKRIRRGDW